MRTAVVLPAPFGPSTPSTVPRGTDRSIPRSARTSPNDLVSPSTRIASSELPCDTTSSSAGRQPETTCRNEPTHTAAVPANPIVRHPGRHLRHCRRDHRRDREIRPGLASVTQVLPYRRDMELSEIDPGPDWAPQACTLPAAERPLRAAQFDELFTEAVRGTERLGPTSLRLELQASPRVAAQAAGRAAAETGCCSFFTFTL